MIVGSIDVIVQATRLRDGTRKITHITEVVGMEGDVITLQDIYRYDYKAMALVATGVRPEFVEKLGQHGITLPGGLFGGTDVWHR